MRRTLVGAMSTRTAYLDHAATTPMRTEAVEAMTSHLLDVGNPSSLHASGRTARRVVEESRETIARALGCRPGEVVFTSVNFQRSPNPIKMSLGGFTGAFDGEPIEQSKLEERQRLLQEEMQKKADEARKKLEDAQKAAKSQ